MDHGKRLCGHKRRCFQVYDMAMEKYDDIEWIKVIKSVYLCMKDHNYEEFEPGYMERAKKYLYGEISIRYGIDIGAVEEFVCMQVNKYLNEF